MKNRLHLGRGAAILACAASLAGTAAVVAPTAASAAGSNCGNKSIKIVVEGEKPGHVQVKMVTVEGGATCAEAVKVISGQLSGKPVSGWKGITPHYELPKALSEEGLFPQELKKGSKKIKYAIHGG
jgi:hypothetical protein